MGINFTIIGGDLRIIKLARILSEDGRAVAEKDQGTTAETAERGEKAESGKRVHRDRRQRKYRQGN